MLHTKSIVAYVLSPKVYDLCLSLAFSLQVSVIVDPKVYELSSIWALKSMNRIYFGP